MLLLWIQMAHFVSLFYPGTAEADFE